MKLAEMKYNQACSTMSDINEHLPTIRKYAEKCDHITELGVRSFVTTWAFLMAKPKKLISVDIEDPVKSGGNVNDVYAAAKDLNVDFNFILGNDLEISLEQTDLLFIDTDHTYEQLSQELKLIGPRVNKYIIMHDTFIFGSVGMYGTGKGLLHAINEFLRLNKEWKIIEQFFNNNGLTILGK